MKCFLAWSAALLLIASLGATAAPVTLLRDRTPAERPTLLVLGTVHLTNPGRDFHDVKVDDVLAPKRQRQIAALVERLAAFHPTHVAVEWPLADQAQLDARYRDYRAGKYQLGRNEVDQIGLRLAARLGLPRVDAVDWFEDPPGKDSDYDFETWAKQHHQQALLDAVLKSDVTERETALLAHSTVTSFLCILNEPARLAADNRSYFDFAMIGDTHDYPGANWVGSWYARNLKIFDNLVRLAPHPQDHVLLVIGAGHAFLLRQYAEQSGGFRLANLPEVLGCPRSNPMRLPKTTM